MSRPVALLGDGGDGGVGHGFVYVSAVGLVVGLDFGSGGGRRHRPGLAGHPHPEGSVCAVKGSVLASGHI